MIASSVMFIKPPPHPPPMVLPNVPKGELKNKENFNVAA